VNEHVIALVFAMDKTAKTFAQSRLPLYKLLNSQAKKVIYG